MGHDADRFQRVETLFDRAMELPPDSREAFLASEAGDDPDLRAEVARLLDHADRGETIDQLHAPLDMAAAIAETPGTEIGPYKLLQLIGEGGFGTVYMAEQETPVRRRVALKVIKLGMDTKQVIARFEAERQALAMMDHANIARVFDAGATETGRPYFVMELVRGVPITEYCDQNQLDTRDRLELFKKVCGAVQHAHQKGIIHRDLKPNNILVTLHDGIPVPKVIDFGIAKATNQRLTEKTLFTEFQQFVGTPEYMSPEQAEMSGLDVDTRSDIYSLGVLLYELLTGTTPFDAKSLRSAAYVEIQRIIREEEPPRPSTRISTLGDSSAEVARQRQSEPGALSRIVKGDLDWIVMKALSKDRTRRYPSASEFAADLDRHMTDEPVIAGPPSVSYQARKFIRRHRRLVATGVVAVLVLAAGGAGLAWTMVQTKQAAARTQDTYEFLADILTSVDPHSGRGQDVRLVDILDDASRKIDARFSEHPGQEGLVRQLFADVYSGLDMHRESAAEYERALPLLDETFGSTHDRALRGRISLAYSLLELGQAEDAQKLVQSILPDLKEHLGEWDYRTFDARRLVAAADRHLGRFDEAEEATRDLYAEVVDKIGADTEIGILTLDSLVRVLLNQYRHGRDLGHDDEARRLEVEGLLAELVERRTVFSGASNPSTLYCRILQISYLEASRKHEEAARNAREVIDLGMERLGEDHRVMVQAMTNLGDALYSMDQVDESVMWKLRSIEGVRRRLGDKHPRTIAIITDALDPLLRTDRHEQGAEYARMAGNVMAAAVGETHEWVLHYRAVEARFVARAGRPADAVALVWQVLDNIDAITEPSERAAARFAAAEVFHAAGRPDDVQEQLDAAAHAIVREQRANLRGRLETQLEELRVKLAS